MDGGRDGKADTRQDGRSRESFVKSVRPRSGIKNQHHRGVKNGKPALKRKYFWPLPWDLRGMDGALVKPYLTNYDGVQITTEIMDEDQRAPAAASKWTFIISSCA